MNRANISREYFLYGNYAIFYYCQRCGIYRADERVCTWHCNKCWIEERIEQSNLKKVEEKLRDMELVQSWFADSPKDNRINR